MKNNLVDVAMGNRPADLVVRGAKLVNVLTREIYPADVAVLDDRIAAVGSVDYTIGPQTRMLDGTGHYLTPGLIDTHIHIHETQLNIVEFAAAVLPRGTTGVCTDFYGEMVVGGMGAVRACLDATRDLPLKVWFVLGTPGYYQNIPFGHSGRPTRDEMFEMLDWAECHGMDDTFASKIIAGDPKMLELVDEVQARGKVICGHGSEMQGRQLDAWTAYVKITDDHECESPEEAIEKARRGVYISMREGSGCFNVSSVVKAITKYGVDPRRFCFCTDLISPVQIAEEGHIDNALRQAIRQGVPPVVGVQMATLNAAECLKVHEDYGSISPGKVASMLLVQDLAEFNIAAVVASGKLAAQDGRMIEGLPPIKFGQWAYGTVRFPQAIVPRDFELRVGTGQAEATVRVIVASGSSLVTKEEHVRIPVEKGLIFADTNRDLLKIAAIERVQGTGEIGVGLIRGFGLRRGALATTYNSQQQNAIIIGENDRDMAVAANKLAEVGGGFVVVDRGEVKALLELPLWGLESDWPYAKVLAKLGEVNEAVVELGCNFPAPFHTLGFMGLPVDIGTLKISPRGLVDVWAEKVVNILADQSTE